MIRTYTQAATETPTALADDELRQIDAYLARSHYLSVSLRREGPVQARPQRA